MTDGAGNITDDDLEVSESLKSRTFQFTNSVQTTIASTFNKSDSVTVSGSFFNVKTVKLKPTSYTKFDLKSYFVSEALKADSVTIKIKTNKKSGFGSKDLQTIILSLVGAKTVVSVLGKALGLDSATELYRHGKAYSDSVVFTVNNPDVYFAARFTKLGEAKMTSNLFNWLTGKLPAPDCENPTTDLTEIKLDGEDNIVNRQLLTCNQIPNYTVRLMLAYSKTDKTGQVKLLKTNDSNQTTKTLSSESYNFKDFPGDFVASTLTLFLEPEGKKGSSIYVNADYKIMIDPKTNTLTIKNREGYGTGISKTCIYRTSGKISFWPDL
jgi:hypothetical protein